MMLLIALVLTGATLCVRTCAAMREHSFFRHREPPSGGAAIQKRCRKLDCHGPYGPRNDGRERARCVSLIPHLCNPQAAVVSPARCINQNPLAEARGRAEKPIKFSPPISKEAGEVAVRSTGGEGFAAHRPLHHSVAPPTPAGKDFTRNGGNKGFLGVYFGVALGGLKTATSVGGARISYSRH
jgi:hypothetical protein